MACPLVRQKDDKWVLQEEGVELMSKVAAPMKVVAVAGKFRTGKSYFLNILAGTTGKDRVQGFGVASTSRACTRGIDVFVVPLSEGGTLVLLDTEGLASMEQDESYDAQIFAISLLLSSFFVLNQRSLLDEESINGLYFVAELSKTICVSAASEGESGNNSSELGQHFPTFMWLLRDAGTVDLADKNNVKCSEAAYLETSLEFNEKRRTGQANEIRAAIRSLFPSRRLRTLVRPCNNEADIQNAVKLDDSSLRPDFVTQMKAVRAEILQDAPAKGLFGEQFDGQMWIALAHRYIDAMNEPGAMPCIKTAWESVVDERNRAAMATALAEASKRLADVAKKAPLPDAAGWGSISLEAYDKALETFGTKAVAGAQAGDLRAALRSDLLELLESTRAAVWHASKEAAEAAAEAGGRALPQPPSGAEARAAIEAALTSCEEAAHGPLAHTAAALCFRRALVPWFQDAEATAEKARAAAAIEAQNALHEAEGRAAEVETKLAGEATRAEALQGQLEQERQRRGEEVGELRQRCQEAAKALQQSQADLHDAEAKVADGAAMLAAERERSGGLQQQFEDERRRRAEEGADWKARHQEAALAHQEAQSALTASEAKVADGAATLAAERERGGGLQQQVEEERKRREEEGADWKSRHQEATRAHQKTQVALRASEAEVAEHVAALAGERERGGNFQQQVEEEKKRREEETAQWKDQHQQMKLAHQDSQGLLSAAEGRLAEHAAALAVERQRGETLGKQVEQEKSRRDEDTSQWKDRHQESNKAHQEALAALKAAEAKLADHTASLAGERQRIEALQTQVAEERRRREDESKDVKERHQEASAEASQAARASQAALTAAEAKANEHSAALLLERQRTELMQAQIEQERKRREEEVAGWRERQQESAGSADRLIQMERAQGEGILASERQRRVQAELEHAALREKLRSVEDQHSTIREDKLRLEMSKAAMEEAHAASKESLRSAEEHLRAIRNEKADIEAQRAKADGTTRDQLRDMEAAHNSSRSQLEEVHNSTREELRQLEKYANSLKSEKAELEAARSQAHLSLAAHQDEAGELRAALERAEEAEQRAREAEEQVRASSQRSADDFAASVEEELRKRDEKIRELEMKASTSQPTQRSNRERAAAGAGPGDLGAKIGYAFSWTLRTVGMAATKAVDFSLSVVRLDCLPEPPTPNGTSGARSKLEARKANARPPAADVSSLSLNEHLEDEAPVGEARVAVNGHAVADSADTAAGSRQPTPRLA